ncbi:hypothetical protein OHC33_005756 [Knufia fluminis]|uniref:Uncharacterized protein n=1 Tax=Knufia fluminis TaxID=191047 RepID=A0AAN8EVL6_9EURO|nr:hypothetical protein OHC33_005756 [Knufia fluminis]
MSSVYSSKRSSIAEVVLHETSKSVPVTPAKPRRKPVFRTAPESPKHNQLLFDDDGLDIEILTHKLQLYQLELEEADLRFKQRRMVQDKQAAEVAAAARFREELDKTEWAERTSGTSSDVKHSRSVSLQAVSTTVPPRTILPPRTTSMRAFKRSQPLDLSWMPVVPQEVKSAVLPPPTMILRASKRPQPLKLSSAPVIPQEVQSAGLPPRTTSISARSKRPQPLHLSSAPVMPQEVQSAALPTRRNRRLDFEADAMKLDWRRTTIAAGRNTSSSIILVSSPGKIAEFTFSTDVPPVPPLSASFSASSSPTTASPMTPSPTEDQIRRELETFAIVEGPDSVVNRRNSVTSRKRITTTFVPDEEDRLRHDVPETPFVTGVSKVVVDSADTVEIKPVNKPMLGRKKSFFSRFEIKNDVDALLDLYMTDEQLVEEKEIKRKATKSKRPTIFKRWQTSEPLSPKLEKPK